MIVEPGSERVRDLEIPDHGRIMFMRWIRDSQRLRYNLIVSSSDARTVSEIREIALAGSDRLLARAVMPSVGGALELFVTSYSDSSVFVRTDSSEYSLDLDSGESVPVFDHQYTQAVASPSGRLLATIRGNVAQVFTANRERISTIEFPAGIAGHVVSRLNFSPDHASVITAGQTPAFDPADPEPVPDFRFDQSRSVRGPMTGALGFPIHSFGFPNPDKPEHKRHEEGSPLLALARHRSPALQPPPLT